MYRHPFKCRTEMDLYTQVQITYKSVQTVPWIAGGVGNREAVATEGRRGDCHRKSGTEAASGR